MAKTGYAVRKSDKQIQRIWQGRGVQKKKLTRSGGWVNLGWGGSSTCRTKHDWSMSNESKKEVHQILAKRTTENDGGGQYLPGFTPKDEKRVVAPSWLRQAEPEKR